MKNHEKEIYVKCKKMLKETEEYLNKNINPELSDDKKFITKFSIYLEDAFLKIKGVQMETIVNSKNSFFKYNDKIEKELLYLKDINEEAFIKIIKKSKKIKSEFENSFWLNTYQPKLALVYDLMLKMKTDTLESEDKETIEDFLNKTKLEEAYILLEEINDEMEDFKKKYEKKEELLFQIGEIYYKEKVGLLTIFINSYELALKENN